MPSGGLISFVRKLEQSGELRRVAAYADPVLEITEITERISKTGGPALLFENNGTGFPLLINAFGSEKRMAMALGRRDLEDPAREIEKLFIQLTGNLSNFTGKLSAIPSLIRLSKYMPSRIMGKGRCQQVINMEPDMGLLPVLKCWPHDGGKFVTLPVVNTYHPVTRKPNAGMYRMQVIDGKSTAMHWQLHKTGASHFMEWRRMGKKMPVSVVLGGDPVYTYAATAPLPENVDEYLLAGFLRRKKIKLVKCITNDIYVPEDADFVIEGYVDPGEKMIWEGPFGDHTGFYSLADWYPVFHVTCITHRTDAVYPATIVGIPPMEDSFIARATEKIFLAPVKLAMLPEVEDLHLPDAGVAHNLAIVRIKKSYPGQGMKVINSLFGAGQMMFSKYIIVVSGDIDIRNYMALANYIFLNTDPLNDIVFTKGPLDVLDHSSDNFAFGGKAGIDATVKMEGERAGKTVSTTNGQEKSVACLSSMVERGIISSFEIPGTIEGGRLLVVSVDTGRISTDVVSFLKMHLGKEAQGKHFSLIVAVDHTLDLSELFTVAWQALGNTDPQRDHAYINDGCLVIDATVKFYRPGGFSRKWPNIVCSDESTAGRVDKRWNEYNLGKFIPSFSARYSWLKRNGEAEIR